MTRPPLPMILFTADAWEHVCPIVRLTGPAAAAGLTVIQGTDWQAGQLEVFLERISEAGLVILQRDFPVYQEAYEAVLGEARRLKKPVVYELDDLLPELPFDHPGAQRYLPTRLAILRALSEVDGAVGSTPAICAYLRQFQTRVHLLPNYLDDAIWQLHPPAPAADRPITIGYLGSSSHLADLEMIAPVLERLLLRYGSTLQLRIWGLTPPESLRHFANTVWTQVGLVSYPQFSAYFQEQQADLVIAPLRDNPFNRSKSAIKFLEYSAMAFPGVYSALEPYTEVVEDGVNGFLASHLEQWEERLVHLIEDPTLRNQMGLAAQETLRKDWLLSQHAAAWGETMLSLYHLPATNPGTPAATIACKAQAWQSELNAQASQQRQQIQQLSRQVEAFKIQLTGKDQAFQTAYTHYQEIMHSTGWRVMQRLFRIREKLIPKNGRLDKILKLGWFSLRVLRREGPRAFARGLLRRTRAALKGDKSPSAASQFQGADAPLSRNLVTPGVASSFSGISLVILLRSGSIAALGDNLAWVTPAPEPGRIQAWAARQTLPPEALELVIWDLTLAQAWRMSEPEASWAASDALQFYGGLRSPYLCLANEEMLGEPETYLEENWIALETESLAFTVNLHGHTPWAASRLRSGLLPGVAESPLLRLVVHKACLNEKLALDLNPWLKDRPNLPLPVGRLLSHTSVQADIENRLPFEHRLPESAGDLACTWQFDDPYWIAFSGATQGMPAPAHVLHPLDSVLPLAPLPSPLPTVILVLQFFAVGGAEQLALNIIRGLKDQVRFIAVSVDGMEPSLGTLVEAFRLETPYVYAIPDFLHLEQRLSFFDYLVRRFQADSLYIANGAAAIYDALAPLKQRHPALHLVNQVYDSVVGWINRYDVSLATYLDAHIGANDLICRAYIEKGARPERVFKIPHAVDVSDLHPEAYSEIKKTEIRLRLGLPQGKRVITFAARLNPQKRPLDFLALAQRFAAESDVVFLMIGDGPLAGAVAAEITRLGLVNLLRHPFYRPIGDVLAISDVLVLPSEFEGMPLIVCEAQAMGKPVVVTDVGNNREVLALTGGGVVVAPVGNIQGLVDGVKQMLAAPPEPAPLRQAIVDHFGIEVIARRYKEVLLA